MDHPGRDVDVLRLAPLKFEADDIVADLAEEFAGTCARTTCPGTQTDDSRPSSPRIEAGVVEPSIQPER
eukprot:8152131-Pyramimonas_sp.AAC.1